MSVPGAEADSWRPQI